MSLAGLATLGLSALWLGSSLGATLTAAVRVAARRPAAPPPTGAGTVLLLRPCAGDEAHLARTLSSGSRARCTLPLHHRFVVAEGGDPAVPVIDAVVARILARGGSADRVIGPPLGPNRKVSQLHAGLGTPLPGGAAPAAVLCVDSDVDLAGLDLDRLVAPLLLPGGPAATWAPPTEPSPRSTGDRASAAVLAGSLHAFPLLSGIDPAGLVGKCFAARPAALAEVGGFVDLAHHLGEDMELSRRLRAAGHRVEPVPLVVPSLASDRQTAQVVARFARWLLVIRAQRPALLASYPLVLAPLPGQLALLALIGLAWPGLAHLAAGGAALAVAIRLLTAALARVAAGRDAGPPTILVDALAGDLVLLAAWLGALRSRRLSWRGVPLRIGAGGRLEADAG